MSGVERWFRFRCLALVKLISRAIVFFHRVPRMCHCIDCSFCFWCPAVVEVIVAVLGPFINRALDQGCACCWCDFF